MTIQRPIRAAVVFLTGMGVGALWSPRAHTARMPREDRAAAAKRAEDRKIVAKLVEMGGPEVAQFVDQFKDLTIHITKDPIDAWAAPDGRFVIRLSRTGEEIASDLFAPAGGGAPSYRVRHYDFASGGKSYSVDFGPSPGNPKITEVQFHVCDTEHQELELSYVDTDGDGRWDRFSDMTHEPPTFYRRDGHCWTERAKVAP